MVPPVLLVPACSNEAHRFVGRLEGKISQRAATTQEAPYIEAEEETSIEATQVSRSNEEPEAVHNQAMEWRGAILFVRRQPSKDAGIAPGLKYPAQKA